MTWVFAWVIFVWIVVAILAAFCVLPFAYGFFEELLRQFKSWKSRRATLKEHT